MNPKRINHELDGEEYELAAPTLGAYMLAFFSLPTLHNPEWYSVDCDFFKANPQRRFYLRPAFRGEIDVFTTEEAFKNKPTLWLLVSEVAPGYHERTPRFRGKACWPTIETDEHVAQVLFQMSLRQGEHVSEWQSFIFDQRIRKADKARDSKRKRNTVIN